MLDNSFAKLANFLKSAGRVKIFIAVLFFVFLFSPIAVEAAISYNVSATLSWSELVSDYDLYVKDPTAYVYYYMQHTAGSWCGDRTCVSTYQGQECVNLQNSSHEGIWYFWHNRFTGDCGSALVPSRNVHITANTPIMLNGELVAAGGTRDFEIPFVSSTGNLSGGEYYLQGLAINIQEPAVAECTQDSDCGPNSPTTLGDCTINADPAPDMLDNMVYYRCQNGSCVANKEAGSSCGNKDVLANSYACLGNKVMKYTIDNVCTQWKCKGIIGQDAGGTSLCSGTVDPDGVAKPPAVPLQINCAAGSHAECSMLKQCACMPNVAPDISNVACNDATQCGGENCGVNRHPDCNAGNCACVDDPGIGPNCTNTSQCFSESRNCFLPEAGSQEDTLCPSQCYCPAYCDVKRRSDVQEDCQQAPAATGNKRCTASGLEKEMTGKICNDFTLDAAGHSVLASPSYSNRCTFRTFWQLDKDCGGCAIATDAPNNVRCGVDQITGNSIIEQKLWCTDCIDNGGGNATCNDNPPRDAWRKAIDCGVPQQVKASYCAGPGIKCTLTASFPGQCFYSFPGIVGGCRAPTVGLLCVPDQTCAAAVNNDCNPGDAAKCPCLGIQVCDANGNWGPCPAQHMACVGNNCQCVAGAGIDQCQNNLQCINNNPVHGECNVAQQCNLVAGPGVNQCVNNNDCGNAVHGECNVAQQCNLVVGAGINQCANNNDCLANVHKACNNQQCVLMAGPGADQCVNNNDCANGIHNECNANQQCIAVAGFGANVCQNIVDCLDNAQHSECVGQQCLPVNGVGLNTCQDDLNCTNANHNECNLLGQCVQVAGAGINTCQVAGDCVATHNACDVDKKCVVVAEAGVDQCQDDVICLNSHLACSIEKRCVSVPGAGANQCATDAYCQSNSYNVCNVQDQCVVAYGVSADQCGSDAHCEEDDNPPYAYSLTSAPGNYCTGQAGAGLASFGWYYADVEGDTESMFILEIDDDIDFSSPEVYRVFDGLSNASGSHNEQTVTVRTIATVTYGNYIKYGEAYYWRVQVQENNTGFSSVWKNYNDPSDADGDGDTATFTFPYKHPAPTVFYNISPAAPAPTDIILFQDLSTCYDDNLNAYPCRCHSQDHRAESVCLNLSPSNILDTCAGSYCYDWGFGDACTTCPGDVSGGANCSCKIGDSTHSYSVTGNFASSLQVCDEIACCTYPKNIPVRSANAKDLPSWKEISPF